MGSAAMAYALWEQILKYTRGSTLAGPRPFNLSAGHGCALLYALLHVTGFDCLLKSWRSFGQWAVVRRGIRSMARPRVLRLPRAFGQGLANGVGMAIAEVALAARFNRPGHQIVDHFTYVLVSDGDLEEGISSEAGSIAGHEHLGKLIVFTRTTTLRLKAAQSSRYRRSSGAVAAFGCSANESNGATTSKLWRSH